MIRLSEESQAKTNILPYHLHVESKNMWYKWTYLQNRSRLKEQIYGYCGESWGEGQIEVWDWCVHSAIFKIDKKQRPIVCHREFCPIFCNNLKRKRRDACVCISESLGWAPETTATLFINFVFNLSVVSDSLWPREPARLLYPWDSSGKNTGVVILFSRGIFPT